MKVIVLGAGTFGVAICNVLLENNHDVTLWTPFESEVNKLKEMIDKNIEITMDINDVNKNELIVIVVPSFALRETAIRLNEVMDIPRDIVLCTKGIESGSLKTGYQIIEEVIEKIKSNVILSGPTHAEEIMLKKFTTIVATSYNEEGRLKVQKAFNNDYLRVYTNDDVRGVELAGAVKNVLAIAAGICEGIDELGDNAKAALITRGLRELKEMVKVDDGNIDTIYGLTGLGDLLVTAYSKYSRNRKFGYLLSQGLSVEEAQKEVGMVVEGLYAVLAIKEISNKHNLDLPIVNSVYDIIYNKKDISEMILLIKRRNTKKED